MLYSESHYPQDSSGVYSTAILVYVYITASQICPIQKLMDLIFLKALIVIFGLMQICADPFILKLIPRRLQKSLESYLQELVSLLSVKCH